MASLFLGAGYPTLVFLVGYPFLILGVVLSKRGAFYNRRFGIGGYQVKSEEDQIQEELKGVPPRYHLFNWVTIGGKLYEHLLVTPNGLMIIKIKGQVGKVKAVNDNVRVRQGIIGWIGSLGEPGVGSPSRELAEEVKALRAWFEEQGFDLPTDGVIVFNSLRTEITQAEDMSFPVCHMKDLRAAIRGWETELNMGMAEQQAVEKLIIQGLTGEQASQAEQLITLPEYKRKALMETPRVEKAEKTKPSPPSRTRPEIPASPASPGAMNQRVGLNGKPVPPKPLKVRKIRRDVDPLPKINPGAYGETSNRKK